MTQYVYGLTTDYGDGSSGIRWFKDAKLVEKLLNDDDYLEEYYGNEGSPAITLSFPDELDLAACGFRFSDSNYTNV